MTLIPLPLYSSATPEVRLEVFSENNPKKIFFPHSRKILHAEGSVGTLRFRSFELL